MSERSIGDYAIIADGETGALINREATIEWLCFRRFDSEACFASLLGTRETVAGDWGRRPRSSHYRVDTKTTC